MNEPARIMVLVDSLLAGGAERLAVEIAAALDRTRFSPHVVVTRGTGPLQALLDDAAVSHTVLDRQRTLAPGALLRARRIAAHSDLIHSHKFGSNVWGALLARATGTPLITHEHNWSGDGASSRTRAWLDRRWIGAVAASVVCVSESVADTVAAHGVTPDRIRVIENGVRMDTALPRAHAREELGLAGRTFVVGITAGLRPEKAHEVLLRAFAELLEHAPEAHLCVLGDGPRRAQLEALAGELGVARAITWAGERRDAARLAAAFDASVICSEWEGLPLAALEALAAEVPLVATSVGALPQLLADGAGIVVPVGDDRALADALIRLHDDASQRRALAAAGRARVSEHHNFATMVARVEELYERALEGRSRPLDGRAGRRAA